MMRNENRADGGRRGGGGGGRGGTEGGMGKVKCGGGMSGGNGHKGEGGLPGWVRWGALAANDALCRQTHALSWLACRRHRPTQFHQC